jgi:hypothetical protein
VNQVKPDRQQALEWWQTLSEQQQLQQKNQTHPNWPLEMFAASTSLILRVWQKERKQS